MTRLYRLLFLLLLTAVLYLELRPPLPTSTVPWIPRWLGVWFDQHDRVKNFVGFGSLAFVGFLAFRGGSSGAASGRRFGRDLGWVVAFVKVKGVRL